MINALIGLVFVIIGVVAHFYNVKESYVVLLILIGFALILERIMK
jgi:hypothetical protein